MAGSESTDSSLFAELKLSDLYSDFVTEVPELKKEVTFQNSKKLDIHSWFTYMQGFSPGLLDYYFSKWHANHEAKFLDPFVGSGTSLVHAQFLGFQSEGWDISPLAVSLTKAKTTDVVNLNIETLLEELENRNIEIDLDQSLEKFPSNVTKHLRKSFPEKVLVEIFELREAIEEMTSEELKRLSLVAFMSSLEESSFIRKHGSHYRFMNTENSGVQRKLDFSGINYRNTFFRKLSNIIEQAEKHLKNTPKAIVKLQDARQGVVSGQLASYVITSPPYLNRNNYIAQSKTEMFLSGLIKDFDEYRNLTKSTLRSHVEAVMEDDVEQLDCHFVKQICDTVLERGESYRGVSKMINGYFEDMNLVMKNLAISLKPGAMVALAIGCSRWSGVVVPTDLLVAHHAIASGHYELKSVDVVRYKGNAPQQMAKWGRYPVRESVVVMERL